MLAAVLVFAGCGAGGSDGENGSTDVPVSGGEVSQGNSGDDGSGGSGGSENNGGGSSGNEAIKVYSVEEFIAAVRPGADIVIEKGDYNFSNFIEGVWATHGEAWNESHEYIRLEECTDGVQLVIEDADGLSISGESEDYSEVELMIDPQYGTVITFEDCDNLRLSYFTAGHTDRGTCTGNVIDLYDCEDVVFESVDLYGCGVYGIGIYDGTENVTVNNSVVRDCFYGPIELVDGSGVLQFNNCILEGSEGFCYVNDEDDMHINLYKCTLGKRETESLAFFEFATLEDCDTHPDAIYPEF